RDLKPDNIFLVPDADAPGTEPIVKPTDSRAAPDAPGANDQRSDASTALLAMAEGSPECIVVVRAVRSADGIHCGDAVVFANAAFQRFWLGDDPAVPRAEADLFATVPARARAVATPRSAWAWASSCSRWTIWSSRARRASCSRPRCPSD
ncbi:MAG: hypothetical protein WCJ30_13730, partial [Deltaproteobacteria bacterium]